MDNPILPPETPTYPAPQSSSTSTSAVMALVLGILSLMCCGFFAGIPAFFVGRSELKAINEKRSSESNRALAKIGMILGLIGAVLSFLFVLAYVILIALGISAGMMQDTH